MKMYIVHGPGGIHIEAENEEDAIAQAKKVPVGIFAYGLKADESKWPQHPLKQKETKNDVGKSLVKD